MFRNLLLAGVAAGALMAGPAAAAITIDDVSGIWNNTIPNVTGDGSSQIRWGTPSPSSGPQSGYNFDGAAPPPFAINIGDGFDLGEFTHLNNPIFGTSLSSASLKVTTQLTIDSVPQNVVSTFDFTHVETPNNATPCAEGGDRPCPDLVTFEINTGASTSFTIDDIEYFVDITGFELGDESEVKEFLTLEGQNNVATLRGVITSTPGDVPEPATLGLMGVGLAGLGWAAARRRRKAA